MKILDRHIGARVASGYLLVLVILLSVFSLLVFVDQLDDVGKGRYQIIDAAIFVLLAIPTRIIEVAPVTALLGSIIGLGKLASGSELIAMQAVGVSPVRIGGSVIRIGVLCMLIVVGFQQFVAPAADQLALSRRSQALSETGAFRIGQGFWSRDGRHIINVRRVMHGQILSDVDIYQFDEEGQLRLFTQAKQADTKDPEQWMLRGVEQRVIGEQNIRTRHLPSLAWKSFLTPEQIGILVLPAETLSLSDLYQYIHYLQDSGQNADHYELSFWKKVSMPVATAAMVLVAIPFMFGPLRTSTAGKRILVGALIGVAFYLSSQIIGHLGMVMNVNPMLITMAPGVALLGIALWFFRRLA